MGAVGTGGTTRISLQLSGCALTQISEYVLVLFHRLDNDPGQKLQPAHESDRQRTGKADRLLVQCARDGVGGSRLVRTSRGGGLRAVHARTERSPHHSARGDLPSPRQLLTSYWARCAKKATRMTTIEILAFLFPLFGTIVVLAIGLTAVWLDERAERRKAHHNQ